MFEVSHLFFIALAVICGTIEEDLSFFITELLPLFGDKFGEFGEVECWIG